MRMKVLYISVTNFADCDFPLIREYQRLGIDITYLILLPPYSLKSTLFDIKKQIPKTGIISAVDYAEFKAYERYMDMSQVYIANRTGKSSLSFSYWKHKLDLFIFLKKNNFDLVHCDYLVNGGMKFLFHCSKIWIQTVHDPFPHSGEVTRHKVDAYHTTMSNADFFVLLNSRQKKDFCEYYRIESQRILVNRLGIYDIVKSFAKSYHIVKRNNILFFGRISPYKGLEYLCVAMKNVRERIPDATLTIAGGGKMYFDIDPYKQLGYIEVINHYVCMEQLAELLSFCELCVCPYTDATQSGVIMTSYSMGKPVIATNVGGLSEMIEVGKTGLLVPPRDSCSLADSIISLLGDKKRLYSMTYYIENHYYSGDKSWRAIAEKYIDFYKSILG